MYIGYFDIFFDINSIKSNKKLFLIKKDRSKLGYSNKL